MACSSVPSGPAEREYLQLVVSERNLEAPEEAGYDWIVGVRLRS